MQKLQSRLSYYKLQSLCFSVTKTAFLCVYSLLLHGQFFTVKSTDIFYSVGLFLNVLFDSWQWKGTNWRCVLFDFAYSSLNREIQSTHVYQKQYIEKPQFVFWATFAKIHLVVVKKETKQTKISFEINKVFITKHELYFMYFKQLCRISSFIGLFLTSDPRTLLQVKNQIMADPQEYVTYVISKSTIIFTIKLSID